MKWVMAFVVLSAACMIHSHALQQESTAMEHFLSGKGLIEKNCGDCMGKSREGLESGIRQVERAIQLGYPDKKEAFELLADAYNTLAWVFLPPDSAEQKSAVGKRDDLYTQLFRMYPEDVDILVAYSGLVGDENEQLALYEEILRKDPQRFHTRFDYVQLLLKKGDWQKAFDQVRKAVQSAEPLAALRSMTERFIDTIERPELYDLPLQCDATRMDLLRVELRIIESLSQTGGYNRTIPVAMEEFKGRFEQELGYVDCRLAVKG